MHVDARGDEVGGERRSSLTETEHCDASHRSARSTDLDAEGGEGGAQAVEVDSELAGGQSLAGRRLPIGPRLGQRHGTGSLGAGHDHDAVVVGADDVARFDHLTTEHDRDVDGSRRRLDGALARHVPRPHGESHRPQLGRVAHAGADHQAADAASGK